MQTVSVQRRINFFFPVSILFLFCFISNRTNAQYCAPAAAVDCSDGGSITNVSLATLNNNSGCSANGYTDYSLDPNITVPVLAPYISYTISITVANSATPQNVGVWIDDSHDGEFDEWEYWYLGTTTGGTLTHPVAVWGATIPHGCDGLAKMRVKVSPSSGPTDGSDPCIDYATGETEDYTIDISPFSSPCSGTPAPGNTISSINPMCPYGEYTISLQNPGDGYGISYQWQFSMDNITYYDIPGQIGSTTSALSLYTSTYFRAIVKCGNNTAISTPLLQEIIVTPGCYYIPAASDCSGGHAITNVTLATLNNTSGCSSSGFADYTSSSSVNVPDIPLNVPFAMTITGGMPGDKVGVWIDKEHDGYFSPSDNIFVGDATGSPLTVNGLLLSTFTGSSRMRVRIESGEIMNTGLANMAYALSETEDYTVNITGVCSNTITTQPQHAILCEGASHTFSVVATGPGLTYQWQLSTNGCGGAYTDIPGGTSADYTITNYSASQNYYSYRCSITGACNTLVSDCAVTELAIPPAINQQPQNVTVCEGGTAVFTTVVWGYPVTNQWQVNNGTGGWVDIVGDTSQVLTLSPVTSSMNGNQYHLVTYGCSPSTYIITNDVTLTVSSTASITEQPASVSTCVGATVSFNVTVSGSGYSYQWQVSTDGGVTFNDITGAIHDTLYINPVTAGNNGNLYQVIISGAGCSSPTVSTPALLTITSPVFVQQPVSISVCELYEAYFGASVTGAITGVQWQESTDGGATFHDIPYAWATTFNIQFYAFSQYNGYKYRLAVTGCGVVTYSNVVTLTVNTRPYTTITANPPVTALLPGESTTLTASVNPAGTYNYSWLLDYVAIPGANSDSYTVNHGSPGIYSVIVTNTSANCADTSAAINITDSADGGRYTNQLYVYSNPNNGVFTVTYPDLPANSSIAVYDSRGFRMNVSASIHFNEPIRVNMSSAPAGVYILTINNSAGERLATGKVIIIH